MSKSKGRVLDRILSIMLAVIMTVGMAPFTALASTTTNPNSFTFTVKDGNDAAIDGASVAYDIKVNSVSDKSGSVNTTAGEAVISDMSNYADEIAGGDTVTIEYTVSKTDYANVTDTATVTNIEGNIDITLIPAYKASVLSTDIENKDFQTGKSVEFTYTTTAKDDAGKMVLGSFVFSDPTAIDTLEYWATELNEWRTFSGGDFGPASTGFAMADATSRFRVTFKTPGKYTVNAKMKLFADNSTLCSVVSNIDVKAQVTTEIKDSDSNSGAVTLNSQSVSTLLASTGDKVDLNVSANSGYQIASVSIGGVSQDVSDKTNFSKQVTVSTDTAIVVSFVKVYTVTITCNANGSVETVPALTAGGNVTVNTGTTVDVTATPNENYRVSSVGINGTTTPYTDNTYNHSNAYTKSLTADKDYTVTITFAPLTYKVTYIPCTNGSVTVDESNVDYDQGTTVHITPNPGYTVDTVTVNNIPTAVNTPDDSTIQFDIANIKEDKEIEVTFKVVSTANMTDVSYNYDDALRANNTGTLYVFSNGSTVTFSTTKSGIRINGKGTSISFATQSVSVSSTTNITKIELYYKASGDWAPAWHTVSTVTNNNPIKIVIDETKPIPTLTPASANANGYYNNDVSVGVKAEDKGDYSGIGSVKYWITCDGTETKRETLYSYTTGDEILAVYNANITVSANDNNSDNVVVYLKVTDRAGNVDETSKSLKINKTKPTISVSVDGSLHAEATTGYYNNMRTATITITDRATTFDEVAASAGISIVAKNANNSIVPISKAAMISSWTSNGDTHTATVTFSTDANYEWEISYKNKADLSNDGVATSGASVYKFAVDTKAPTGSITIDGSTWNSLISTLTFGLWKNYSVTAIGESNDVTSPVYSIKYYKSNTDAELTEAELVNLYNEGKFTETAYTFDADEQFAVYARITDYAGNTLYIGSNGVIVDMTDGIIDITPDAANAKGFYNDDVNVNISVDEEAVTGKAYSGIKLIDYKVIKDNDTEHPTQAENLYTFTVNNPTKAQLKKAWTGKITVDKELNNSDNVKVIVMVRDNAGNEYSKEITLAINIDRPTIDVSFDNNTANRIDNGRGYFGSTRTATVTINDRAAAFNAENATAGIIINAVDAKGDTVALNAKEMISDWSTDGNNHTATITFAADGNYTWSLSYTNDADNANTDVVAGASVTPYDFTIDTTNPTGKITVETNTWDQILSVLTFGLYSNVKADVSATADDVTSPVIIEYYKTSNPIALSAEELDNQTFSTFNAFSIDKNEQFVVYLKITDYAGNYIYINSDGYIVDKESSNIVLTPSQANGFYDATANGSGQYGIYNSDLNVAVQVTDAEPYSGIKTVDYWVVKDNDNANPTQSGNLYTFNVSNPTQAQLTAEWNGNIPVNTDLNNSCNVVVYVKTVDNAGNENTQSVKLDIDITAPTIDVTFDNNQDNAGNTYFNASRTATVVITERPHHFNAAKATDGITITAVDANGKEVESSYTISAWNTKEGTMPDAATHTATITFSKDANYTFAIAYTDEASNVNTTLDTHDSVAPYKFTVDTTNPTGTVKAVSDEGRTEEWNELNNSLTFGFWSKKKIAVSGTSDDATSPVASVVYYKVVSQNANDNTSALTATQLDAITSWQEFNGFNVAANEQFAVYIKITDNAGNYTYISTNGLIVDDQHPMEETIAPEITVTPEQPINGIYKGDVKVSITVDDPLVGGTYSGLKEVSYAVFDRAISEIEPTQSGILYSFSNTNPTQAELLKTWNGSITVDSKKNNSNDIRIVVYAKDNSLNSSDDDTTIKLDTTAPVIDISYDNNSADSGSFFKENRTATIVVTERNFNSDDVKLEITNTDGVIPAISAWSKTEGTGNQDNTKWTATVLYAADGDYTFGIEYTDLAGNKGTAINYAASTVAGTAFAVDKTIPTVAVSYDNNSVQNSNYYKDARTATIVITEHNFNSDRVKIDLTATNDGANAALPTVSGWSTSGDKHTATINYSNDSLYSFDISFNDKAGNAMADFEKQSFYVDKTVPELSITGVADKSANSGNVIPVVSYSDTNYDSNQVTITLTGANRKSVTLDGSYSDIHNGRTFTFTNFAKEQSVDDIYTLTATLTDKAGNISTKTINFSVNRFGSTYALGSSAEALNGSYVKAPVDVVVTETNANELNNIKITLFKNDQTIALKEGEDYSIDVKGGNGQWYEYTYTIFKKNFEDDGVYRLTLHSEDAAGNVAENTLDTKDKTIRFGVDKTAPTIVISNLEDGKTYPVEKYTVTLSSNDNLKLSKVVVYLDGNEITSWGGEKLEAILNGKDGFSFEVGGDSTKAHSVKVVATDEAGNETTEEVKDFYVTTNVFVRYYNNKALFFGSIGGVLLLIAGIVVLVVLKKKKQSK
ncbi:MAG: Ig-like domain repeat protein [Eubacteriales bacterium]|nr:Ig-like domain repeat protein [Eubacteriales bacterium]